MHWARWLTQLLFASLLLSATLAHAQEAPATATGDTDTTVETPAPDEPADDAVPPEDEEEDANPTWFGMGFESRQSRFRRDMGLPSGAPGGASGGHGNGGNGFGR